MKKSKIIFASPEKFSNSTLKDDATAFNNQKSKLRWKGNFE